MLNRKVVLESPLKGEELRGRLAQNLKPVPGWATWWTWPRDKGLWGSASAEGFQVQLGRARQLVAAKGTLLPTSQGTRVRVAVGFKDWLIPYLAASDVALVVIGLVIATHFGDRTFVVLVVAIAALGSLTNIAVGLMQERDLLRALSRVVDAQAISG